MFNVFAIAADGLAAQSRRIEAAARAIASTGSAPPVGGNSPENGSPVRIGALPVGDPIENVVTLLEAELAYRANVAVIRAASDMLDTLLDAVHPKART